MSNYFDGLDEPTILQEVQQLRLDIYKLKKEQWLFQQSRAKRRASTRLQEQQRVLQQLLDLIELGLETPGQTNVFVALNVAKRLDTAKLLRVDAELVKQDQRSYLDGRERRQRQTDVDPHLEQQQITWQKALDFIDKIISEHRP